MDNRSGCGAALNGRVALVTGGARGIGRAIAVELARRGADVAINCLEESGAARRLQEEIGEMGVSCSVEPGDVCDREQAHDLVERVIRRWERIDILVNNAGVTLDRSLRKTTWEEWSDFIQVNVSGVFHCTCAALPHMVRQEFGRIINIDVNALPGQPGVYGGGCYPAKDGVAAFTRAVALEMARYNITANCIVPGFTATEMLDGIPQELLNQLKARIPMGRFARPEEIGKAAGFLAADGAYITGQQLSVNGGLLAS